MFIHFFNSMNSKPHLTGAEVGVDHLGPVIRGTPADRGVTVTKATQASQWVFCLQSKVSWFTLVTVLSLHILLTLTGTRVLRAHRTVVQTSINHTFTRPGNIQCENAYNTLHNHTFKRPGNIQCENAYNTLHNHTFTRPGNIQCENAYNTPHNHHILTM